MAGQILVLKQHIRAHHDGRLTEYVDQSEVKTVKPARMTQKSTTNVQKTAPLQPRFQPSSITRHASLLAVSAGNQASK
jgi:hypothetical protein